LLSLSSEKSNAVAGEAGGSITAPVYTRPNNGPRPASSTPTSYVYAGNASVVAAVVVVVTAVDDAVVYDVARIVALGFRGFFVKMTPSAIVVVYFIVISVKLFQFFFIQKLFMYI
jgi:hypothetical protein